MIIDDIKTPQHMEFKFYANFCSRLMTGITIDRHWLQVKVNNQPATASDPAKFRVDATINLDGEMIGVIDIERKPQWAGGKWRYSRINFPYKPFTHFENGGGSAGAFSSKAEALCSVWKSGNPGFWVAYSSQVADSSGQQVFLHGHSCLVVPAEHIFGEKYNPRLSTQRTRYNNSVDVVELPNSAGLLCTCEEQFTEIIVSSVTSWIKSQEVIS